MSSATTLFLWLLLPLSTHSVFRSQKRHYAPLSLPPGPCNSPQRLLPLEELVPVVDSQPWQRAAEHALSSFLPNKIFIVLLGESSTEFAWRTVLLGEKGRNIRTYHDQNTAAVAHCDTAVAAASRTKLPQNQKPRASYTASRRGSFPTWSCPTAPIPSPASQPICGFAYPTTNHTALERAALNHPAGTATLSSAPARHRCCNQRRESGQTSSPFSTAGKDSFL